MLGYFISSNPTTFYPHLGVNGSLYVSGFSPFNCPLVFLFQTEPDVYIFLKPNLLLSTYGLNTGALQSKDQERARAHGERISEFVNVYE